MLQTQALILVSGNLYARDGITCDVGQRPGPSKQGRISGLASKSGKFLAMLHLHMLIDDCRGSWGNLLLGQLWCKGNGDQLLAASST